MTLDMGAAPTPDPSRYGGVRVFKIKRALDDLRKAVRAGDFDAANDALDRYEPWAQIAFEARSE